VNAVDERTGGVGRAADEATLAPVITVTRGRVTDAELAALTAVLLAARTAADAAAADATPPRRQPSPWAEGSRVRPAPPRPGPHAWRASALPR
jgi:hypothetical protein